MKKKLLGLICMSLFACFSLQAAQVDTLLVRSESMNKDIKVVAIRPDKAVKGEKCPVIYLLHGHGGHAKTWIQVRPDLPEIADRDGIIFVCPDGGTSWYWDSPVDSTFRYETFVAKELVAYTDKYYPTVPRATGRAITGLSMGGQGSLYLAVHHPDVFGAAGSMSGGVDIRPFPKNWDMAKRLGTLEENRERWDAFTLVNQMERFKAANLALIIDCGTDDFFYQVNLDLHKRLLEHKVNHDFIVKPGVHNWDYWIKAVEFQLLFFQQFFER